MNQSKKELLKRLSIIALPVMLQSLIQSGVGFLDTLMIGQLGESEVAAVGSANQFFFFIQVFFFGISGGATIFLSQYFGGKKLDDMRKVTSFAITLAIALGAIGTLIAFIWPSSIIHIFSSDSRVIKAGAIYLTIVSFSYPFSGFSLSFSSAFRASGDSATPMIATTISLFFNAIFNALLIFGLGPFPHLGVMGGAIATLGARIIEALILLFVAVKRESPFLPTHHCFFHWSHDFLISISKTMIPVILHEGLWVTGSILYKIAYSSLGTGLFAAVNIDTSIADLFFVAGSGLSSGAAVIVGNVLGEGDKEKGLSWGLDIMKISLGVGIIMGLLEAILAPHILSLYNISPEVLVEARKGIYANALIQSLDIPALVILMGILRSGGDSLFSLLIEIVPMYLLSIPLAFIGASLLHFPLWALFILKIVEIAPKLVLGGIRVKKGKWVNVIGKDQEDGKCYT